MIKLEGRGFKSHPGQSFPLSLCGPISICRANAHMVYGLKHQHFTFLSQPFIYNILSYISKDAAFLYQGVTNCGFRKLVPYNLIRKSLKYDMV